MSSEDATTETRVPANNHQSSIGRPVKPRLGRCGTCRRETNHRQYQIVTQGIGMTNTNPIAATTVRQKNSQTSRSAEIGPPESTPALIGRPLGCRTAPEPETPPDN